MTSPTNGKHSDREPINLEEDRYSRLRMIEWWDQDLLRKSKVVVVGAGALGNEILKNLAMLGIGNILIIDFDSIETSNLSRSVLYRSADDGASKAHTAAKAVRDLNPDCRVYALNADVCSQVGCGVYRWADVVICGLDSRQARMAVNAACWKVNIPWVDGATESFQGIARVFRPPDGVCYECTLGENDMKLLNVRNSCGFLAREAVRRGRTPTTPTTSAVIAGVQVQEAIKLLHSPDLCSLIGRGFFFDGNSYDCFTIDYVRRDDCLSHDTFESIVETDLSSQTATLEDVMHIAQSHLGGEIVLDMPGEMITELHCGTCNRREPFFRLLGAVDEREAVCPVCGALRVPDVVTECEPDAPFASIPLAQLGFGALEVIAARNDKRNIGIEITMDRKALFGEP